MKRYLRPLLFGYCDAQTGDQVTGKLDLKVPDVVELHAEVKKGTRWCHYPADLRWQIIVDVGQVEIAEMFSLEKAGMVLEALGDQPYDTPPEWLAWRAQLWGTMAFRVNDNSNSVFAMVRRCRLTSG